MSFNLVSPIRLGQWGTSRIIMLPKHAVAVINHPKILTWHAVASAAILGCLHGVFYCEAAQPTDGPISAWSRSALTGLLCSLCEAEVNNEREIESVTLRMASAARSSLSHPRQWFIHRAERACELNLSLQPLAPELEAFFAFWPLSFVPEVSANGPQSYKSVDATDGTVLPKNVSVYSGMPPGF